jgi:hypothetical protein
MENRRGPWYRHAVLFPSRADRERWDDLLTRALAAAHDEVATGAVTPAIDEATFRRELAALDFATPRGLRGGGALDYRPAPARRGPHDTPALFRAFQSVSNVSGSVRRPHCSNLQSATRQRRHVRKRVYLPTYR